MIRLVVLKGGVLCQKQAGKKNVGSCRARLSTAAGRLKNARSVKEDGVTAVEDYVMAVGAQQGKKFASAVGNVGPTTMV